jgi:hypothetical protein
VNGDWITIETRDGATVFAPGEVIAGTVSWHLAGAQSIELRLLWYTEGKGDQDSRLVTTVELGHPGGNEVRPFNIRLPEGPFSFSGKLISLLWALEAVAAPGSRAARLEITVSPTRREILLPGAHAGPG